MSDYERVLPRSIRRFSGAMLRGTSFFVENAQLILERVGDNHEILWRKQKNIDSERILWDDGSKRKVSCNFERF